MSTYGRGVEGQRCRPGTVRQGALCYEEPSERFTLIGGVAWEHCTGDVPHECGAMCTRDAATCSERVREQAMSIFGLVTDALSEDVGGAINSATDIVDSFAIAKCRGIEDNE